MKKVLIALLTLTLFAIPALAQEDPPTAGIEYQWESKLGKLRADSGRPNVYVFDTYEPMTAKREDSVQWNERVAEKIKPKLTEKAFDIHQRLLKIDDVGGVFITYRLIMIQTFPLVRQDPLPAIKEILK